MSDNINSPKRYTVHKHECIDEMVSLFGEQDVLTFCKLNAWKYRYRAGAKGDAAEDNAKADWYIEKATQIRKTILRGCASENREK